MFCPKCGKEIPDDSARFCMACGEKITPTDALVPKTQEPNIKKKSGMLKLFLKIFGVFILVAGIALGTVAYIQSTPMYRLKNSNFNIATSNFYDYALEIYTDELRGTSNESKAISIIIDKIMESDADYFYDTYNTCAWNEGSSRYTNFNQFVTDANTSQPSETTQEWATYCERVNHLVSQSTPI